MELAPSIVTKKIITAGRVLQRALVALHRALAARSKLARHGSVIEASKLMLEAGQPEDVSAVFIPSVTPKRVMYSHPIGEVRVIVVGAQVNLGRRPGADDYRRESCQ